MKQIKKGTGKEVQSMRFLWPIFFAFNIFFSINAEKVSKYFVPFLYFNRKKVNHYQFRQMVNVQNYKV